MSEFGSEKQTTPESNPETNPEATVQRSGHHPKRHGRNLVMWLAGAALLVGGAFAVQAVAQSERYEQFGMNAGHMGGWHRGDRKPLSEMSQEEIADRIERMVRHMAIEIDATDEQEARIVGLMTGLAGDIKPMAERMQATKGELSGLLSATTIDRDALERLRSARLAEADRISKTLVGTIADVAETLTPEQRAKIAEMIRERREMFERHRRG